MVSDVQNITFIKFLFDDVLGQLINTLITDEIKSRMTTITLSIGAL